MNIINMSMNEMIESKWRSTDSDSDIVHDESITETINGEFDLVYKKKSDKSTIKTICNNQNEKENKIVMVVEEGLLNAMNNLQIASVKKLQHCRHPVICGEDSFQDNDKHIVDGKTSQVKNVLLEVMQPEIDHMKNKAMKLMSTQSPKVTKVVSPSLPPQPKLRMNTLIDRSISKRVVKTISNTENCVRLKEERINFFGIPVTTDRKKRTQVKPFNFQNRINRTQQLQKPHMSTVPQKLASSSHVAAIPTRTISKLSQNNAAINGASNTSRSTNVLQKVEQTASKVGLRKLQGNSHKNVTMRKCAVNVLENSTKINDGNDSMSINNIIGGREIKPVPTTVSHILSTDRKQQFKVKIQQREMEMEKMRAHVEEKKREKGKLEENVMRKRMEIKRKPMPAF